MKGDGHVRFRGNAEVKFPCVIRLSASVGQHSGTPKQNLKSWRKNNKDMTKDKYSIEVLSEAIQNLHSEDISTQKKALNIINSALCRPFATTYNEVAEWAVSEKVRETLFALLNENTNQLVMVNAFHAVCNICCQMIDVGTSYRDIPNFPYIEPSIKFKEMTFRYAEKFLTHKKQELRLRSAKMLLHWGNNKGWDIVCRQLNIDEINSLIPLISVPKSMFLNTEEGVKYDLHGNIVPKEEIITHQQSLNLKEALVLIVQKHKEKYQLSEYSTELTKSLLTDIEYLINETGKQKNAGR